MKTLLSLFLAWSAAHAADRWYEIRIAGQPAGYQHSFTEPLQGGGIRSTDETLIVINRLGNKVEMKIKSASSENARGVLLSVRDEVTQSQQTTVTEAELQGGSILLRSTAGGNSYNRSMVLKDPVCGPAEFARRTLELRKPGDTAECRLYTPSTGVPYQTTRTLLAIETVNGHSALRVKTELANMPGAMEELLDSEGFPLRLERDMPFGKMTVAVADRQTALQAGEGGELPAESYEGTMARSNVRLADARALDRLKIKITHKKPELGWPGFASPMQTVLEKTADSLVLEITQPQRRASATKIDEAPFLRPNQILQSDDPEVTRLAHQIAGGEPDRYQAARKLQDWVASNMQFDLGIAVVPASEVARNRKGTCIAYSVLLASMARALGIPSRLAMGYVYVSGIWGGHAWVEVLVDNQWLPLDSAAYRPGLADAARIQFGSYTGENNLTAFLTAGYQMYGNVEISILEYSAGGKTIAVPPPARPYSVSNNEYRNPGLGFTLEKPAGFEFAKVDSVYPDPTILQVTSGQSKAAVALEEAIVDEDAAAQKALEVVPGAQPAPVLLDGRRGSLVSSPNSARVVLPEGRSLWIVSAEGPDARALLDRIVGGWKWIAPR